MADSLHQIVIQADPDTIYKALTQDKGIKAWWTDTCDMAEQEGDACLFWFDDRQTCFTMRANKMLPERRVFWVCQDGPTEWVGTELWWEIQTLVDGRCLLDFKHMNWQKDDGIFALCNSTWGNLLQHLKDHCENGDVNPWFHNLKASA